MRTIRAHVSWVGLEPLQEKEEGHSPVERIVMSSRYSISTNPLEYAAEVAYIVATSPTADTDAGAGGGTDDEFEFSLSETQLRQGLQSLEGSTREARGKVEGGTKAKRNEEADKMEEREGESKEEKEGEIVKRKPVTEGVDFPEVTTPLSQTGKSTNADITASIDEVSSGELQKTVVIYGPTSYVNHQLVSKLVQSNPSIFSLVVPHTSRKKQQNEINGLDFHFINRKEMSDQIRKGSFIECVKISLPKPKPRRASAATNHSQVSDDSANPINPVSPSEDSSIPLNPWRHIVQVPSPLLTPKTRQRSRTNSKTSDLYGTSKEAIRKARLQGKPCVLISVTYKGAEQLKRAGCEGVYILLDIGGEGSEQTDAAEHSAGGGLQPDHHITAQSMEQAFSELQRCTFQTVSSLPLSPCTKLDITRDEWDNLPTVEMDQLSCKATSPVSKARLLTFNDLLVHYHRQRISTRPTKTKKMAKGLRSELDLVLSLSAMPLSDTDEMHIEALQTIYQKLMGSSLNCRRYGPHWQDIGFLGVDPGENLKEGGFFGVMQLISFLDQSLPLAMEIFNYSREGTHQFPFAEVSMSITEIALRSLRGSFLTKLCNKQDQVFVTLNDFHMAMFYRFFRLWKSQGQTPSQMGLVIGKIEGYAKKHPKNVIADLLAYLQSGKDEHGKIAIRKISHSLSNPFTPFDRLAEEQATHPTT